MAKDKSKKKGGKPAVDNDEFGKPSDAPAGGDGWKFATDDEADALALLDYAGHLAAKERARS